MLITHKEFIQLYDEHVAAIYRYVLLRVSSVEVAQDLTSEVFLRAWSFATNNKQQTTDNPEGKQASYGAGRQIENPKAFFYKIARNLVIDFYRQKPKQEISLESLEIQIPDLNDNPAKEANLSLEMKPVIAALNQIKDDYRDVIIWHYLDELTVLEIADILGKTENATRVMLSRGLQQLREKIRTD